MRASGAIVCEGVVDGKDGMVYEIVSSVGSVTIPSDASTATLSASLSFYRRQGTGARETYSCYYAVFRKKGSTYSRIQRSTSKVNSANISFEVTEDNTDAIVACMYDQLATEHSGYLAELEIPVRKNGDTGEQGEPGDDGQDAATLVFEPAVVVFRADSNGNVLSGQTFSSMVTLMLPNGATATPTLSNGNASTYADCSDSGRTITVSVDEDGYTASDIEGYYAVTGTATIGGVTYVAKGSLKITVARDGADGPRGLTGPMAYIAGKYDATVNYGNLLTDTTCPVVLYTDGYYWYPTEDYRGTGYPPSVANGWKMAYNFEMILTKVLFAQFAKLGGFVVSGDYMLSHYGELIDANGNKLTLTEVTDDNGFRSWQYNGVDAYTYFRDYDPMVTGYTPDPPLAVLHRNGANGSTKASATSWANWSVIGKTTTYSKANFGNDQARANAIAVGDYFAIVGVDTSGGDHRIVFQCTANATSLSGKALYFDSEAEGQPMYYEKRFRPAKVVNAVTGEEWMAGGKVHVGADGGVTVEGTIRAKNLYRNLCLFSNGVYSTEVFYISSLNDWSRAKGYAVGDYIIGRPDANAEPDFSSVGMVLCTYDADIIQMVPTSNNSWDSSNPLRLPAPKDFPGKVVEITGWSRTTSEVNMYVGSVMGSVSSMCLAVEISGGKFVPAETATVIAIRTGTTTRFMSMLLNGNYYWTKLNEK